MTPSAPSTVVSVAQVPGLYMVPHFLTAEEESTLLATIDALPWSGHGLGPNPEMKRRTQQYGCIFSYRYRKVMTPLEPLPPWGEALVSRLMTLPILDERPNTLIINEYEPGQGIMPHTDAPSIFGNAIVSLSLNSPCLMMFNHTETSHTASVLLEPRSLVILTESSRYDYKHSISKNRVEVWNEYSIVRGRRVSLTFRYIPSPPETPVPA
ncbi:hypothetical protein H4R35_000669 [Dimargaris xerosporica]|nr:hypothetical protein H4R35_000669 [Dimargaris xerosporica]